MRNSLLLTLLLFCSGLFAQFETGQLDLGLDTIHYLVNYPDGYDGTEAQWPLVLFLHGGGESGDDLELVKRNGLPKHLAAGKAFPFITLAPQNKYTRGFWDLTALAHLLDHFEANNRVDASRIYLTGLSRGGLGAWMLAMQHPDRFAALLPVCGAVPASYDIWIPENLPIWIHHGAEDGLIHPSESINMIENLRQKKMNPKPLLTIYEGIGHNAWEPAYADPKVYEWLLAQSKGDQGNRK